MGRKGKGLKWVAKTARNCYCWSRMLLTGGSSRKGESGCVAGPLIVEPGLMQGVNTILEDAAGTVVYLGLYRCLPEHSLAAAQHYYPKDAVLQIKEPFYKVSGDGTPIIRMDDPINLEVVVGDANVAAEHRRQGKQHFTRGEYVVAAGCYVKALRAPCPPLTQAGA